MKRIGLLALGISLFVHSLAWSALRPEKVHVAENKKVEVYLRDGLITGGDRLVDDVSVRDIRRSANKGYERVVLDLEPSQGMAIERPSYYQVAVNPEEQRLIITVWGKPKLLFDAKKVLQSFKKSRLIDGLELLPRVEEDSWTFVVRLKGAHPVEVFELAKPSRIILDIKGAAK